MSSIIQAPTPEIVALCDIIDRTIEAYLAALGKGKTKLGRFEAETEAYCLLKLVIRHAEAFVLMARHDLVLLPAAQVAARSAFEAHLKILWMLKPVDPFEQEARWVLHVRSSSEHWAKLAKSESLAEEFRSDCLKQKDVFDSFSSQITQRLTQQGYAVPPKSVSLWDILKDLDQKHLYPFYIHLSAFAHTNYEAGSLYRKHLGTGKQLGEFITPAGWALPIEAVWKSLFVASRRVLELVEPPESAFPEGPLHEEFQRRLSDLNASGADS